MKKLIMILFILGMGKIVLAQTNIFPSSGNVGIGTTSPSERLEVSGSTFNRASFTATGNVQTGIKIERNQTGGSYNTAWELYTPASSSDLRLYNAGDRMTFSGNGNVGIGTTSPSTYSKLHIYGLNGAISYPGLLYVENTDDAFALTLKNAGNTSQNDRGIFEAIVGSSSVFRINNTGNVGIGTITPDSKLTVAGKIHAQEVKVTTNAGADFVFEDGYKLPSLTETEHFINQNKHLPEIAPAKDMIKNGINLGEMNIKLLQKIEELTLHLIIQNKKNKEQDDKLQAQEQLIKQLSRHLGVIPQEIKK